MDLKTTDYLQNAPVFQHVKRLLQQESPLEGGASFYCKGTQNPFASAFADPLCNLNLKETSDFVKALPLASKSYKEGGGLDVSSQRRRTGLISNGQRRLEAPSTPGRPFFGFAAGNPNRRSVPSKWDDAEKWLVGTSCHESPAHVCRPAADLSKISKKSEVLCQGRENIFEETFRVNEEKSMGSLVPSFQGLSMESDGDFHRMPSEVILKDKFTNNVETIIPAFGFSDPTKEGFLFKNTFSEAAKNAAAASVRTEVGRRDVGTEMTPLGSSTTSRCPTPFMTSSPMRHNTPADRSGLLVEPKPSIDISELRDRHFAKLDLGGQFDSVVSNWSSRAEEEEDVSKSLRHFEMENGSKGVAESRAVAWEEEEKVKICTRYQREEAKIQAWVNLQSARAEAETRKLEVKIEKMRSSLEEKVMRRMATVHRKAEEWRASAQLQHSQQMRKASEQGQRMKTTQHNCLSQYYCHGGHTRCGCFPCSNNHHL